MQAITSSSETMIEMIKVSKQYPPNQIALDNVSISIGRGEMFFLIGRSGAGKTTLLKLLYAIESPSNGLIEIDGLPINDLHGNKLAKLRQRIGVAYQDFKLLLNRTAAENIAISMEVSYKKPHLIEKRVRSLLEKLDLSDKHDIIAGDLSRGEQQRITLARAIANSPSLLLVDEPTGNLDMATTTRVMDLLNSCNKSGATVVIATHDQSLYGHTSHRVMELERGQILSITGGTI